MSEEHVLKCWSEPFAAVRRGDKTHEVRVFDRDYKVGDCLRLREWNPGTEYTGEVELVEITHVTPPGARGLPPNVGVMSIRKATDRTRRVVEAAREYRKRHALAFESPEAKFFRAMSPDTAERLEEDARSAAMALFKAIDEYEAGR